jgi:hypothetical protein
MHSSVVKAEEVIVAVVTSGTSRAKMESLGELHRLLSIFVDDKVTRHESQDTVV